MDSTWLNFEAGALAKVVDEARVVPLLHKVPFADVARPLGMFMAKPLDEKGVKETLIAINNSLPEDDRRATAALDGIFKAMWPELKEKLNRVQDTSGEPEPRDSREILEEILGLVRFSRAYGTGEYHPTTSGRRLVMGDLFTDSFSGRTNE
jgi:hypothetical protein